MVEHFEIGNKVGDTMVETIPAKMAELGIIASAKKVHGYVQE